MSMHSHKITIIKVYALRIPISKYMKQRCTEMKGYR